MRFVIRRLLLFAAALFGISIIVFAALRVLPGDVASVMAGLNSPPERVAALRSQLGLDRPLIAQYADWIGALLHGDFGTSYMYNQPVLDLIAERIPSTLQITVTALVIALILGVTIGMFSALHQYSVMDYVFMVLALVGCSSSDGDKTADYPKENITVIVPYSAGGPTDMSVRALLDAASKYLPSGVSFMPENQTGAGGLIGMSATAASDNDGYTLGPIAVDLLMMKYEGKTQLGLDSFVPLAATMADPYGLLVAANNGKYDSVEEFVAYCKAHPGEVTVGNSGVGTATHLAAIAFERDFGITLNHVSYDGSADVVAAMAGGHLDASFTQMQPAKSQVEAGTLKMLGFLADERMESYPDIPTVSETMNSDTNFRGWVVVCAPAGTDQAKIDYLSDIFAKAVASDEYKAAIRNLGMEPVELTGTALNDMLKADDAKYAELCTGITLN